MTPLLIYALFAGGMGWSISKKRWGLAAFCGAMCVWMIAMQLALAFAMRPVQF